MSRTPRELLASCDSLEIAELLAFDNLEPVGDMRGDIQAAVIAQTAISPYIAKGQKIPPLLDFMPLAHRPPERPQSEEEMKTALAHYMALAQVEHQRGQR